MFKTIEQKFHRKEVIQIINPKEDLTGKRFGRWTVLQQSEDHISPSGKHRTTWLCQCDCGTIREVMQIGLKDGTSQSCGCLSKEMTSKRSKKMFYKRNSYDLSGDYGIGYTCNGEFYFDLEDNYPYYDEINPKAFMTDSLAQIIKDINSGKKDNIVETIQGRKSFNIKEKVMNLAKKKVSIVSMIMMGQIKKKKMKMTTIIHQKTIL